MDLSYDLLLQVRMERYDPPQPVDWSAFAAMLLRTRHLKFLTLYLHGSEDSSLREDVQSATCAIGALQGLEFLLLGSSNPTFLPKLFCPELSNLANLTHLIIDNWCSELDAGDDVPSELLQKGPPPRLKSISSVLPGVGTIPEQYLSWLFRPWGEYALENLSITHTSITHTLWEQLPRILSLTRGLRALEIRKYRSNDETVTMHIPSYADLVDLKVLRLFCHPHGLATLQESVEELLFVGYIWPDSDSGFSILVSSASSHLKRLRKVTIVTKEKAVDTGPDRFPLVFNACKDRGIELLFEQ